MSEMEAGAPLDIAEESALADDVLPVSLAPEVSLPEAGGEADVQQEQEEDFYEPELDLETTPAEQEEQSQPSELQIQSLEEQTQPLEDQTQSLEGQSQLLREGSQSLEAQSQPLEEEVQPDATLESSSSSSTAALPASGISAASAASPVPSVSAAFSPLPQRESSVTNGPIAVLPAKPTQATLAVLAGSSGSGLLTARKPRILNTRQAQLRARLDDDPADGEAWLALISDAQQKGDLEKTREVYEDFFKHFPNAGRQWIAYADLELQHINFDRVEDIFRRCLRDSTSVELWRFYITYLRRRNPVDPGNAEKAKETRAVISSAFDFSLSHIGIDREAGSIWQEYLAFLREGDAGGQWEEQQKMDVLRRTYQRAVGIPLDTVEEIWADYNTWENTLNKMTARKFIGEKSASYTAARLAIRVMRPMLDAVSLSDALPRRPDWTLPRCRKLLEDWKAYLAWEEGNPLQLDDATALQQRILYAYRKATAEMRFYPEIWFSAAAYTRPLGLSEETAQFFNNGMTACPTSLLLHFGYAELLESKREFAESHTVYDNLLSRLQQELEQANSDLEQELADAVDAASKLKQLNGAMETDDAEDKPDPVVLAQNVVRERFGPRIYNSKSAMASVWINRMRFARRAEGKKQARDVFGRARKASVLWQVYEAAAMVEYHLNKEPKVAEKVFELGFKQGFDKDVDFVLRYLDYLINVNDDANARAVFERTIGHFAPDVALRLWERWSRYESEFGDLAAIQKLDERIAEAYPAVKPVSRFAERTGFYLGLSELPRRDMGVGVVGRGRAESTSSSPPPFRRKRSDSPIPPPRVALRDRPVSPDGRGPPKRGRFGRGRSPSPPVPLPRRPPLLAPGAGAPRRIISPPPRSTPPPQPSDEGDLPEAISFFLRILPSAASFITSSGPSLDGNTVADVISSASSLVASTGRRKAAASVGNDSAMRSAMPPAHRSLPPRPQSLGYGQAGRF